MKTMISTMLIGLMLCGISIVYAETASFKITVTIPAIVGLNVPPYDEPPNFDQIASLENYMTTVEEITLNDEKVIIKTMVVK